MVGMRASKIIIAALIALVAIPSIGIAYSVTENKVRLSAVEDTAATVSHPDTGRHIKHVASIGNFAAASNQCAFATADYRATPLSKEEILAFYSPYVIESPEPRATNIQIYFVDELDSMFFAIYGESFRDDALHSSSPNETRYIILTTQSGYPANFDIRCH
jgi:hypothetical protein